MWEHELPPQWNPGTITTADTLVFEGRADGRHYTTLLVGWGGIGPIAGTMAVQHGWKHGVHPRRLYTFALHGDLSVPPSAPPACARPVDPPDFDVDAELAEHGRAVYARSCFLCHGGGAVSGGYAPDLRASPNPLSREALRAVVVDGARHTKGTPRFRDFPDREIDGLIHCIRQMARRSVAASD